MNALTPFGTPLALAIEGQGTEAGLLALAQRLLAQGQPGDAQVVFEHLDALRPGQPDVLAGQIAALSAEGRTLDALQKLARVRSDLPDSVALQLIQALSGPTLERFNLHLAAGEMELAEPYIAALAAVAPGHLAVLSSALACNVALARPEAAGRYAQAVLQLDPENVQARQAMADLFRVVGDEPAEIAQKLFLALSPKNPTQPLIRLRDIHDVASHILRRPLNDHAMAQLQALLLAGRVLNVPTEPDSEFAGWEKHYRLLLNGVDLDAVRRPPPPLPADADLEYAGADGAPLDAAQVRERADELGAQVAFFAAADEAYVELYARWYALSVLKYSDAPCLVVVHVIGGRGRLDRIAQAVGVDDPRLVFVADGFDAEAALNTRCYESPPKGLMAKPVAHYQSVRFQRLGGLLQLLGRPVFVSDIDLLLQRGVTDLLDRTAADDVVLNENEGSSAAGSRITANLLLARPTAGALAMCAFLRSFLDRALAGPEVTRWIDQLALILARQNLALTAPDTRLGYFDTSSDINNVMYPSFQEHPFRFLSLYHGFDTASLEDPRVLGEAPAKPSRKAK